MIWTCDDLRCWSTSLHHHDFQSFSLSIIQGWKWSWSAISYRVSKQIWDLKKGNLLCLLLFKIDRKSILINSLSGIVFCSRQNVELTFLEKRSKSRHLSSLWRGDDVATTFQAFARVNSIRKGEWENQFTTQHTIYFIFIEYRSKILLEFILQFLEGKSGRFFFQKNKIAELQVYLFKSATLC